MPGAPREDLRCAGSRTRAAVGVPGRERLTGEAAAVTAGGALDGAPLVVELGERRGGRA